MGIYKKMDNISFKTLDAETIKLLKSYHIVKSNKTLLEFAEKYAQCKESSNNHFTIESELMNTAECLLKDLQPKQEQQTQDQITLVPNPTIKKTRIYMDGVFDIIHSGHFNALRQGKKFGHILVVGVNSDSDVEKAKGPPLMNVQERANLVRACKWVDEVVID